MTNVNQLREDVASCTRMLASTDILNYSGHVSVRIPGTDRVLIQRTQDVRTMLEPARLLVVDLDGHAVDGAGEPPSEVFIHTETYRARPDVAAVAHFHHDPTTVFSVTDGVAGRAAAGHPAGMGPRPGSGLRPVSPGGEPGQVMIDGVLLPI